MKPSFALDIRDTSVALLHRTPRGWREVGEVALDAPDLADGIEYLRATALGLSPQGITTKVLIPGSQILYTEVEADGPDGNSRRDQIRAALEGRTPYAVGDLVFDWSGDGPVVQVAVLARETLEEAESFALQNRLNPVSFAAVPPEGAFSGEPWFGTSGLASSFLEPGEQVERDLAPVVAVRFLPSMPTQAAGQVEETAAAVPDPAPRDPAPLDPQPEPAPDGLPGTPEPAPAPAPTEVPAEEPAPAPEPDPAAPAPFDPDLPDPDFPDPDFPDPGPADPEMPAPAFDPLPDFLPEPDLPPAFDPIAPGPDAASPPPAAEFQPPPALEVSDNRSLAHAVAAMSRAGQPRNAAPLAAPVQEAPMAIDVPVEDEAGSGDFSVAAGSRRLSALADPAGRSAADGRAPAPRDAGLPSDGSSGAGSPGAEADDELPAAPAAAMMAAFSSRRSPAPERAAPAAPPLGAAGARSVPLAPDLSPVRPKGTAAPRDAGRPASAGVTAPSIPGTRRRKQGAATQKPATSPRVEIAPSRPAAASAAGAAAGTVFRDRNASSRGKPRYLGLILTAILLLLLGLVAALSSFTTASNEEAGATRSATLAPADAPDPALSDPDTGAAGGIAPTAADEAAADLQPLDDIAEAEAGAAPPPAMTEATGPAPDPVSLAESTPATPPASVPQDEIFLATTDLPPATGGAQGLTPPPAAADAAPATPAAPPPFGTVYRFDEAGRIIPTKDGIATPEGVTLFAGKPKLTPPDRPARIAALAAAATGANAAPTPAAAPAAATPAAPPATAPASVAVEPPPGADPALAAARPRARPAGIEQKPTPADDAALPADAGNRLTSLRPRGRAPSAVAAGEAARQATAAASLAAEQVTLASAARLPAGALEISRRPAPRPRDLSRAVEAAVAAAVRAAPPETAAEPAPPPAARVAAAPPPTSRTEVEADDEPEVAEGAAPKIPVKASVAKQATFNRAINLSKTNLIGVYGSASKRYALIRQSNGSYKKVQVGDTIDGGRIAAITASEVRYQKGSRMLVLAMPEG